jgi:hypothetical protein
VSAPILDSKVREDGSVIVTVGREDFAQANLVLTADGRGSAHLQEIADTLYHPETVQAITISRTQEQKRV